MYDSDEIIISGNELWFMGHKLADIKFPFYTIERKFLDCIERGNELEAAQDEINELENDIEDKNEEIEKLKAEIRKLEHTIDKIDNIARY